MWRTRDTYGARGCVKGETLFHTAGRHGHVRVKDVALSFPCPIQLLRHVHPLAMVNMGAVRTGDLVRPGTVGQIAAALGGSNDDLNLGKAPILAGLELGQNRYAAVYRF